MSLGQSQKPTAQSLSLRAQGLCLRYLFSLNFGFLLGFGISWRILDRAFELVTFEEAMPTWCVMSW